MLPLNVLKRAASLGDHPSRNAWSVCVLENLKGFVYAFGPFGVYLCFYLIAICAPCFRPMISGERQQFCQSSTILTLWHFMES